ncbi:MAG: hypothetical protein LBP28_05840 [Coriobacteriales bacterium]|jgi:cell fate regulator YaaT (PSP1 superfamily)|nr:hypothetical protein [Coriobacteriales bacterium]
MATVTAVKMRYNPKTLWFDPQGTEYGQGDYVLVETERGREVGQVVEGALEVSEAQIKKLKSSLKPVVRQLSDIDFDHLEALDARGREALPVFRELIAKHELDIKAVQVEYLFSGNKAIFYFASDVRVDFRELVRELASHFHVRVDMRQIGARDEARMVGGLAHCGEEFCCARMGCEFQSVSIRMAKEQDLPLNPAKISGACGRLMCCLRYEFEAYKDFKQRAPKKGTFVQTPLGDAKIVDLDTPREVIHLRLEGGKSLAVPLADMDCERDEKGCACKCRVSRETINRCASSSIMLALSALDRENERLEDQLLGGAGRASGSGRGRTGAGVGGGAGDTRTKRRRRRGEGAEADAASARASGIGAGTGRLGAAAAGGVDRAAAAGRGRGVAADSTRGVAGGQSPERGRRKKRVRSGGVKSGGGAVGGADGVRQSGVAGGVDESGTASSAAGTGRRRRRPNRDGQGVSRRDDQRLNDGSATGGQAADDFAGREAAARSEGPPARPRPGQRSSGVRNPRRQRSAPAPADSAGTAAPAGASGTEPQHRRRRRRSEGTTS